MIDGWIETVDARLNIKYVQKISKVGVVHPRNLLEGITRIPVSLLPKCLGWTASLTNQTIAGFFAAMTSVHSIKQPGRNFLRRVLFLHHTSRYPWRGTFTSAARFSRLTCNKTLVTLMLIGLDGANKMLQFLCLWVIVHLSTLYRNKLKRVNCITAKVNYREEVGPANLRD